MLLQSVEIYENVHYIGVNDREVQYFENLWPLPNGVAYNSYLLTGEKTALLDTTKIERVDTFLAKLDEALKGRDLDYLVIHHMEPDHAGSVPVILETYPDVKIVGNAKTKEFMLSFFDIEDTLKFNYDERFIEVDEGDSLDLGDSTLTFYRTPMVHWPESMVSFQEETGILFSQDAFGSFGALDGGIFDDEVNYNRDYLDETIRYYACIISPFSMQVKGALNKLGGLDIKMICPVHGIIWRENPEKIIDIYSKLANQETQEGVVVVYGSMYGHTRDMAEMVARSIAAEGIKNVKVYDVSKVDLSYLLRDTWRYSAMVLGSVTYQNGLYPKMDALINALSTQRMSERVIGVFGSHLWNGQAQPALMKFAEDQKFDIVDTTVDFKGAASKEDRKKLVKLGKEVAEKLIAKRK